MLHSLSANKQCRQLDLYEVNITVDGTAGTPAASGIDANAIASITDLGTGNYKINFVDKAARAIQTIAIVAATASRVIAQTASDQTSVTVQARNLSGNAADSDFAICMNWHGSKHLF